MCHTFPCLDVVFLTDSHCVLDQSQPERVHYWGALGPAAPHPVLPHTLGRTHQGVGGEEAYIFFLFYFIFILFILFIYLFIFFLFCFVLFFLFLFYRVLAKGKQKYVTLRY